MKTAIAFIGSWNAPMPAAAQTVSAGSASARDARSRAVAGAVLGARSRFAYSGGSSTPLSNSWWARAAMPVSKTSSSGRMPASRMRSASATIVCGALRLALSRKFSEPSVRLAMSGFSSPASASTSAALVELRVRAAAGRHAERDAGAPPPQLGDDRAVGLATPFRFLVGPAGVEVDDGRTGLEAAGHGIGDDLLGGP